LLIGVAQSTQAADAVDDFVADRSGAAVPKVPKALPALLAPASLDPGGKKSSHLDWNSGIKGLP
jgi:hypothetical protein